MKDYKDYYGAVGVSLVVVGMVAVVWLLWLASSWLNTVEPPPSPPQRPAPPSTPVISDHKCLTHEEVLKIVDARFHAMSKGYSDTTPEQAKQIAEAARRDTEALRKYIMSQAKVEYIEAQTALNGLKDAEAFNRLYREVQALKRVQGIEVDQFGGIKFVGVNPELKRRMEAQP